MTAPLDRSAPGWQRVKNLVLARSGALTSELVRRPGGFGLGQLPARLKPDGTTTVTCGFCSTGCGLRAHLIGGEAVNLSPDARYPVNRGMACPKGWEALAPLAAPDRAVAPLLRPERGQPLRPVDYETAIAAFVWRLRRVQERYGPESVAFLGTGQIPTEELALLGALAKFGMGMVHGDGNTRQCMATAVTAYKQSFGFDAPPYTYRDFEASDVIVLVGSNLCISHPILWERICRNRLSPEIVVIDPRRTETAMAASLHLPIRPKSDLVFFYALARALVERGVVDRDFVAAHTEGFSDFSEFVAPFSRDRVARECGIDGATFDRLVGLVERGKAVSFWWTMGVNQSHEGVRVAQALINLALLTGNIGRPGTGANSITGQCNAMGSRLFSNTSSLFCGRDFESPSHRREVARLLDMDEGRIPAHAGFAYDQIVEGIVSGKIRGLWIVATNTAHSWINQADLHDALGRLDFLCVQDMYDSTETAQFADLVLPAAGWGEKEGTFINSERRIGRVKRVARAPGQALADFYIFKLIADAWGVGPLFARWRDPAAVFSIMKELSRGRPCDFSAIAGYDAIDELEGVQWPLPEGEVVPPASERRLFENGRFFTDTGRARFVFEPPRSAPEPVDERFPLLLLTGRGSSSQWHTGTRTSKSAILRRLHAEEPYVEVHPKDARRYGFSAQKWARLESRRGSFRARIVVTPAVGRGTVFVPMHYARANQLTFPAFDPYSRQPAYKACAVRLAPDESGAPASPRPAK